MGMKQSGARSAPENGGWVFLVRWGVGGLLLILIITFQGPQNLSKSVLILITRISIAFGVAQAINLWHAVSFIFMRCEGGNRREIIFRSNILEDKHLEQEICEQWNYGSDR